MNERRIILAFFHAFLAGFGTFQHVVERRSQIHFEEDTTVSFSTLLGRRDPRSLELTRVSLRQLAIPTRLARKAGLRARATLRSTGVAFLAFWATYVILRRPVLRFILVNFAGSWARSVLRFSVSEPDRLCACAYSEDNSSRPHLYTLMKHSGAYSPTLATRAISSGFLFLTLWEVTNVVFEVYATQVSVKLEYSEQGGRQLILLESQPMSVSQFASNPNQSLLSGLRAQDPYYQVRTESSSESAFENSTN